MHEQLIDLVHDRLVLQLGIGHRTRTGDIALQIQCKGRLLRTIRKATQRSGPEHVANRVALAGLGLPLVDGTLIILQFGIHDRCRLIETRSLNGLVVKESTAEEACIRWQCVPRLGCIAKASMIGTLRYLQKRCSITRCALG